MSALSPLGHFLLSRHAMPKWDNDRLPTAARLAQEWHCTENTIYRQQKALMTLGMLRRATRQAFPEVTALGYTQLQSKG